MSSVAAPADRRFRRAHVKPARKRRHWRAMTKPLVGYGLVLLVSVYAAYRLSGVAAQAHVLEIDRVIVRGNERLSLGEVMAVLSGLRGESLLWTDLNAWRRRLLASPWVRDAALRRSLPSTVEVFVRERQPIGIGRINDDVYLVDEEGVIIDQYGPQYADLDLPILDGLAAGTSGLGDDGSMADRPRAAFAARVVAAFKAVPTIAPRISQIDVSDLHNATVTLEGDPTSIELGEEQFVTRLQMYLDLAPTLRERVPDIDYVDLRFENRIYVRPAPKRPQSRTAAPSGAASRAGRKK
jgi:cell division protein FtsQ